MFLTLALVSTASCLLAVAFLSGTPIIRETGGRVIVASVGAALYTATALLGVETYGRTNLPLGKFTKATSLPGAVVAHPIEYASGMLGSRVGRCPVDRALAAASDRRLR
ncbi:MAG: hypothetical protein ACRDY3_06180 [Acidimicrobiales bacterium]